MGLERVMHPKMSNVNIKIYVQHGHALKKKKLVSFRGGGYIVGSSSL